MRFPDGRLRKYEFNGETYYTGCSKVIGVFALIILFLLPITSTMYTNPNLFATLVAAFSIISFASLVLFLMQIRKITVVIGIVERKLVIVSKTLLDRIIITSPFSFKTSIGINHTDMYSNTPYFQLELKDSNKTKVVFKETIKDSQIKKIHAAQELNINCESSAKSIISFAPYPGVANKLYNLLKEIDHPDVAEVVQESNNHIAENVDGFDPFLE